MRYLSSFLSVLVPVASAAIVAACGSEKTPPGPPPVVRQSCESSTCHGPSGEENAIELAHPGYDLSCTDCHGGDGDATEAVLAHVAAEPWVLELPTPGYLKNLSVDELDRVDPAFLRFVNPGDFRVASTSCGSSSPADPGNGCHQPLVDSTQRSVMSTFVGHFDVPRFQAGMQGRAAELGSSAIESVGSGEIPRGAVLSLEQAEVPDPSAPIGEISTAMDHYLVKNCTRCHQASFGKNDVPGNYRSSGCTACHMIYDELGQTGSMDPSAVRDFRAHPVEHELTSAIPGSQCETCHHQGARIGLLFRGVIEWEFDADPIDVLGVDLPNAGGIHGRPDDGYLQASVDPRFPPDLHFSAGMTCVDCHVGRDVHGDGWIYSTSKFQVSVRCENCHGNIDQAIAEGTATAGLPPAGAPDQECSPTGPADAFLNCAGNALPLFRNDRGEVEIRLAVPPPGGPDSLPVPQIHDRLELGVNPFMTDAMGRRADTGFSHTEVLECSTCHTAYRQYCFGCHVEMDYSLSKKDGLSGLLSPGIEIPSRDFTSLDLFFVGMNQRGKIGTFCPSMQVFMSVTDESGTPVFTDRIRTSAAGHRGFNWAIDEPHVAKRRPQECSRCHRDADGSIQKARETFGFGTGRFAMADGDGILYDLTQFLDPEGVPIVSFSHEGQGAVPKDMIDRALGIQICRSGNREVSCDP